MINYRFVSQGEYFITSDPDTVLVTSGMTECIAIAFIDKENPNNRLLAHIDGQILYSDAVALANLSKIQEEFKQQTNAQIFSIYLLGGQHNRRNNLILQRTLQTLGLFATNFTDINQFCADQNQIRHHKGTMFFSKVNPMTANATLICDSSDNEPNYILYQATAFSPPLSESQLESGQGLHSATEKEEYALFAKINDEVLKSYPSLAQKFRTSADAQWIDEHRSLISSPGSDTKPSAF